ncbi:Pyruvate oxidase [bioreactor metagenome]|uniref:Pyruvate oxidase n=1 Tax=bioreactor metagenome TaxID=1076179 RepID=A0A645JDM6_9ZZZZ
MEGADFGKVGEALGADGFTITEFSQLRPAFDAAAKSTRPVVIDVKISDKRPLPVEDLHLDPRLYSAEEIESFKQKYEVHDMPVLHEIYENL